MPIRRIRDYADLVRAGDGNEAERLALLQAPSRRRCSSSSTAMRRNLEAIEHKIEIYRDCC